MRKSRSFRNDGERQHVGKCCCGLFRGGNRNFFAYLVHHRMSTDRTVFPETKLNVGLGIHPEIEPFASVKVDEGNHVSQVTKRNDKPVTDLSKHSKVEVLQHGLKTLTHTTLCDCNLQERGHRDPDTSGSHGATESTGTVHLPDTDNARPGTESIPRTTWLVSHGQRPDVVMARNLLDHKTSELYVRARLAACQYNDDVCPIGADAMANAPQSAAFSPGGESNPDSCYDSDASSVGSRRDSTGPYLEVGGHSDVSRTTSDTLGAEYGEVDPNVKPHHLTIDALPADKPEQTHASIRRKTSAHKTDSGGDLMSNQEYAAKVEFALRLGYSEGQTQAALCKVGYQASEDTLLGELVQAGCQDTSDTDSDDEATTSNTQDTREAGYPEQPEEDLEDSEEDNLRNIVIDGSNVAMSHGAKDVFSCRGIKLAVDWFRERGHKDVTVFVPSWRKESSRPDTQITDQELLKELETAGALVFTPARRVPGGKRITCYDDRYVIKLAAQTGGIVVSNDNYRDLAGESPDFKRVIEERLLMYSFVSDRFMPPDDPLGRHGPGLADFLRKTPVGNKTQAPICPYGKKCTYGNKCKFYHPERGSVPLKSVTERIAEQARSNLNVVKERGKLGSGDPKQRSISSDILGAKKSLTRTQSAVPGPQKMSLTRTRSVTTTLMSAVGQKSGQDLSTVKAETRDIPMFVPTDVDSQEYHRYNDKLSELRVRIEQADLQEKDQEDLIKRRTNTPSRGSVGLKHNSDPVVRHKPSQHWSVMHESLRATHSDPSKPYNYEYENFENPVTGGHLALAKKLSDEGKDDNKAGKLLGRGVSPNRQSPLIFTGEDGGHAVVRGKASFPNSKVKHQNTQGKHHALQRQLSLTGADDSRLKLGSNLYSPAPGIREDMQVLSPQAWATPTSHESLDRNFSFPLSAQDRTSTQLDHRQQQFAVEETRSPQTVQRMVSDSNISQRSPKFPTDNLQGHQPIQRMGSAPMMPSGEGHIPSVRFHGVPRISRQNSTSDPQLNAVNLDPPPANWTHAPEMHRGMLLRSLQRGPVPPHFNHPMKVHFGPGPQAAGLQPKQHLMFPQNVGTAGFPNMSALAAQQAGAPFYPQGPTSVTAPVRAALPGYYVTRHTESPVPMMMSPNQDLTRAASPSNQTMEHVSMSPRQQFPTHTASSSSLHNPHNSTQNAPLVSRGVPHPLSASLGQMAGESHDLSDQENPRHGLYYHLCHLFKEDEVRRVLEEHPEESDPQKLCKYLIER